MLKIAIPPLFFCRAEEDGPEQIRNGGGLEVLVHLLRHEEPDFLSHNVMTLAVCARDGEKGVDSLVEKKKVMGKCLHVGSVQIALPEKKNEKSRCFDS